MALHLNERIAVLEGFRASLQIVMDAKPESDFSAAQLKIHEAVSSLKYANPWFSEWSMNNALHGILQLVDSSNVNTWVKKYDKLCVEDKSQSVVGIVMAGNIPAVGFHDLLCVFLVGDVAKIKFSSDDKTLIPILIELLAEVEPRTSDYFIVAEERLGEVDKVVATGGNNTSRYFEYYFKKYPNIIRKSRTSVAVLNDKTSESNWIELGKDIFSYFGLGCRNVTKLFLPTGFNVPSLIEVVQCYANKMDNVKYINNLEYHKSIMLINAVPFLDGGLVLLKEDASIHSPLSVLHYEFYDDLNEVEAKIEAVKGELQCVVGTEDFCTVNFGETQSPNVWDYADEIDVVQFLLS